jgi:hypothetical protein
MEPVVVHRRLDRRHLGDMEPQRIGIVAVEAMAAVAAAGGLHSMKCRSRSGGTSARE